MIPLAGLLLGLIIAVGGTRASMALARALGILDFPGEIKIHGKPTPRFGGFGIVLGTLVGCLVATGITSLWDRWGIATLGGALVIGSTGAIDDIRGLRPPYKLLGQFVAGTAFVVMSWLGLERETLPGLLAFPYVALGVLFIAFMSNALNLLDGMDGLAAGTTVVMASFLTVLAFLEGKRELALTLGTLVGACLGFLIYNAPPAKTFMGDTGSLFLGYMMAIAGLQLCFMQPISVAKVLGVLLVLAVPIVDTCLAMLRRLRGHHDVFSGDRYHIYDCIHRKLGGNTWRTLGVMWGITLVGGAAGLLAFFAGASVAVLIAAPVILGMVALASRAGSLRACAGPGTRGLST